VTPAAEVGDDDRLTMAGWDDHTLRETALANLGVGADAGVPDDVRFRVNIARLLTKRLKRGEPPGSSPAVFLLHPDPQLPTGMTTHIVHMLDNGLTPVDGNVWFVGPVASLARRFTPDSTETEALVELVVGSLGLGSTPAVFYEPRTPTVELRFFPVGLEQPDVYEPIALIHSPIDIGGILDVVEGVHKKILITPDAHTPGTALWKNKAKHFPVKEAELVVQTYLHTGLTAAFPTCVVRREQSQVTGRLDIEIEEPDYVNPTVTTRHAVLELKGLYAFEWGERRERMRGGRG